MTRKAKRAVAITMLSIILIGLAFCISALAVSSVNGTTFTATVTEWWGVVVKAFSQGKDKPGVDKPGVEKPGTDNPDTDKPGVDKPGTDNPGEGATAVCYDENGNELKPGVRYAFQNSLNFAEARGASNPEGGITITASIIPASAFDKRVNWSVEWVDSTSDWAKGKTVTDYVTVTADTTDSRIATVNCSAPFGSQIKVVATSVANEQATANCLVDYYKKGEDMQMGIGAIYKISSNAFNYGEAEISNYTQASEPKFTRIGKNAYSMCYTKLPPIVGFSYYGVKYTEHYVDNSIGTKEGLKDIYLKACWVNPVFTGKQMNILKDYKAKDLYDKTTNTNLGNCRLDMVTDTTATGAKRGYRGPTIDSLNIAKCLGATFNDEYYEEIARTILAVTEAGEYHYEYILEATDVLTGEKKEITIKVRLDDSFIPEPRGVELDNGNIGF